MQRILHCLPGNMDMGGIEKFLMSLYENIDKSKFQFDFIVHKKRKNFFEDEIKNLGGHIYKLPNKRKNPIKYKKEFLKIIDKYEIIHIHSVYAFTYFEAKWAFNKGKKVILHSHNSDSKFIRKVVHVILKKPQNKYTSLRVAPSVQSAKWMFPKYWTNVTYLYNGFDINKFVFSKEHRRTIRRKNGFSKNDYIIGDVGRLDWQKDPMFALQMFDKICKKESKFKLVYIGSGSLEEKLKSYVHRHNLSNKVFFLGNISNVNEYLNMFDAFVMPTRYEGLGISLVEAQLNGLPVFVSKGIPKEAIINDNVYLLSKNDDSEWISKIVNESISENNRKVNLENFSNYDINNVVEQLQRIYSNL